MAPVFFSPLNPGLDTRPGHPCAGRRAFISVDTSSGARDTGEKPEIRQEILASNQLIQNFHLEYAKTQIKTLIVQKNTSLSQLASFR